MGIELIIPSIVCALFVGCIIGYIISNNNVITNEDLRREYDTGYRFGYNDALDDIEIDFEVDLKEYREIPY